MTDHKLAPNAGDEVQEARGVAILDALAYTALLRDVVTTFQVDPDAAIAGYRRFVLRVLDQLLPALATIAGPDVTAAMLERRTAELLVATASAPLVDPADGADALRAVVERMPVLADDDLNEVLARGMVLQAALAAATGHASGEAGRIAGRWLQSLSPAALLLALTEAAGTFGRVTL